MLFNDYNYLRILWDMFCVRTTEDTTSDALHHALSEKMDKNDRKQLLRLVDSKNMHTEIVSLESFISGFRLAVGIASELSGKWYDFNKEEDACVERR